ncbi:hypothetical protein J3B02_001779 [Coemansia erecta]|uniref:U three protein 23 n=1 Tax=Coemansia asiatica TaxID=1052880 RepID=A0A9W8CHQ1_9FUNG|nr:hypothetical protein LPJ64_005381 [Coemansia asiatica]KAJ2856131.1 hypothetical protein J3B02_001779 [Coemansia erecta]KAJ2886924.1 hypothetical protein FB639_001482 [Coemansia asiatica]
MRSKRAKAYRKAMHFYQQTFGFHEPYQVLISPDLVLAAVEKKVDIKQTVQDTLQGQVKFYITYCGICDVRKESEFKAQAISVSKTFEKRHCMHKEPVPGTQCIEELIGDSNKNNYCVAAQSNELRAKLRGIAGVPVLHMQRDIVILERMAQAAKETSEKQLKRKLSVSEAEKKLLRVMKKKSIEEKLALKKNKPRKLKKAKGPNPLSIKKQTKKQQSKTSESSTPSSTSTSTSKSNPKLKSEPNAPPIATPKEESSLAGTKHPHPQSDEAPSKPQNCTVTDPANADQTKHKRKRKRSRSKKSESTAETS